MIISHKHKFIFIAIPKTGTHAIRFALREHMGEEDEEQVGLFVKKKLKYESLSKINHGHISCIQAREALGEQVWNNYFKFTFVRNPWDRYISFCSFIHRENPKFQKTPELFLRRMIDKPEIRQRILFRPQVELICDNNNIPLVDFIGKYENLQEDYDKICKKIGVSSQVLEQLNASNHKPFREYYNDSLFQKVNEFYNLDISTFNYTFT